MQPLKKTLVGAAVAVTLGTGGAVVVDQTQAAIPLECDVSSAKVLNLDEKLRSYKIDTGFLTTREMASQDKANIKACEIVKSAQVGKYTYDKSTKEFIKSEKVPKKVIWGLVSEATAQEPAITDTLEIEIVEIEPIEGGVQVFARAWENGEQIGFGTDGTVDIERFRIFNPPILVPDEQGTIVREWTDEIAQKTYSRNLREDPEVAILQSIEHTIFTMKNKSSSKNIIADKRGNTTSTFYPAAGASSPVDGRVYSWNSSTYSTVHAGGPSLDANNTELSQQMRNDNFGSFFGIIRHFYLFDTSTIGSGQAISSATLSLYSAGNDGNTNSYTTWIVSSTPASNSALATTDWSNIGSTAMSDTKPLQGAWNGAAYTDFALNASGISNINKTGISKFGSRLSGDITATAPTGRNSKAVYFADQTGTTQDPKLVVEHAASASRRIMNIQ